MRKTYGHTGIIRWLAESNTETEVTSSRTLEISDPRTSAIVRSAEQSFNVEDCRMLRLAKRQHGHRLHSHCTWMGLIWFAQGQEQVRPKAKRQLKRSHVNVNALAATYSRARTSLALGLARASSQLFASVPLQYPALRRGPNPVLAEQETPHTATTQPASIASYDA